MKKVLIIGGSSGMGLATAKKAAEQGYQVTIASRSLDKLMLAQKSIGNGNIPIHTVDTTDENSIQTLFEAVGNIDHLILPASEIISFGNIHTASVEEAKQSFNSKLFGPFRVIQNSLPYLNADGSIVLFSGTAGTKPEKDTEIFAAINGAIDSFSRALAISLSPIRVNCIAPGIIDTPPVTVAYRDETTKKLFDQFKQNLLVRRMGNADEIADAVLYLIKNAYVTGTTLYVDGGHVIS